MSSSTPSPDLDLEEEDGIENSEDEKDPEDNDKDDTVLLVEVLEVVVVEDIEPSIVVVEFLLTLTLLFL